MSTTLVQNNEVIAAPPAAPVAEMQAPPLEASKSIFTDFRERVWKAGECAVETLSDAYGAAKALLLRVWEAVRGFFEPKFAVVYKVLADFFEPKYEAVRKPVAEFVGPKVEAVSTSIKGYTDAAAAKLGERYYTGQINQLKEQNAQLATNLATLQADHEKLKVENEQMRQQLNPPALPLAAVPADQKKRWVW